MTPAAAARRLAEVAGQLERLKARRDVLYAERVACVEVLEADGMAKKDIAAIARVAPNAISVAMNKARSAGTTR